LVRNIIDKERIFETAFKQDFILQVSAVLIFVTDVSVSKKKYGEMGWFYSIQDATIACTFSMMAAESIGLSSCWVGIFDQTKIATMYNIDLYNSTIVSLLPIGYMKENFII
jgi:nitroreductase